MYVYSFSFRFEDDDAAFEIIKNYKQITNNNNHNKTVNKKCKENG